MKKKGFFITLDGGEGSGKSTQIQLLENYFKKKGIKVVKTFEPGGTILGWGIRLLLLRSKIDMRPETETLLYMASRSQLTDSVILPALRRGETVISDRWIEATLAYQGYGSGVSKRWIRHLGKEATQGLKADLTLYLDLPAKRGLSRAKRRSAHDRIESRSLQYHNRVIQGYRALARQEKRMKLIRVSTVEKTHQAICKAVDELLRRRS